MTRPVRVVFIAAYIGHRNKIRVVVFGRGNIEYEVDERKFHRHYDPISKSVL